MSHALIIDDNLIVSRAIQERLQACGYESFDYAWTENQALEAAVDRPPDLIVIGDSIAEGSPLDLAEELARANETPVLVVTAHRFMLQQSLPHGAAIDGPYPLGELDEVLVRLSAEA